MKSKNQTAWALLTLGNLFILGQTISAQQVVMPEPPPPAAQPVWERTEPSEFEVFTPQIINGAESYQPFRWGLLTARPHVFYRFSESSGIQSTPGNAQDTIIQEFSPGIAFDVGAHWLLDYTPTFRFYSDSHFKNEFDNAVTLSGRTSYDDWLFGLSENFSSSSSPQVQTGMQTDQKISSTSLTASYTFNSRMSLDSALNQTLTFVKNSTTFTNFPSITTLQDSREWSIAEYFTYHFWDRLNIGIGPGLDYIDVDTGANQLSESISGRVNWRATDKISFQVTAGIQDQQFLSGGAGNLINPTFGASIQWQPFEVTQISLQATRAVTPSLFANQDTETTSLSCDLNQRFLGKFYLDFSAGYNISKYVATTDKVSVDREDDSYTLGLRFSHSFLKRGTVGVSYQYGGNSSSASGFSYSSSQIGIDVGYSY